MATTFACDHCGKSISVTFLKAGELAMCHSCGEHVTVPESGASTFEQVGVATVEADAPVAESVESEEVLELDPAQMEFLKQQLENEQNLPLAVGAGLAASIVGATVWAAITVATSYQIGFMAIGVGFLVGLAVRAVGKGISNTFGMIGAGFSMLGCLLGNLLAMVGLIARHESMSFFEVLGVMSPDVAVDLMVAWFSPIDLLFYAIALYQGYNLAFRQVTGADLKQRLTGSGA